MATKYVVELTKAQLSMVKQAMETHFLEIDTLGYNNSEKACFDRTDEILMNSKTKAEYLRENK
ncbi:MAG: hypothetical protein MK105_18845 [Crocinitomicaceae bacterium]|nr:hypothetical protein [Crocinitomicaceae bacterium]